MRIEKSGVLNDIYENIRTLVLKNHIIKCNKKSCNYSFYMRVKTMGIIS
jgi:hypothetical protein